MTPVHEQGDPGVNPSQSLIVTSIPLLLLLGNLPEPQLIHPLVINKLLRLVPIVLQRRRFPLLLILRRLFHRQPFLLQLLSRERPSYLLCILLLRFLQRHDRTENRPIFFLLQDITNAVALLQC